jgi:hypothetical protein
MDEKPRCREINRPSDSDLKEILFKEDEILASLPKPQLEVYREGKSKYELSNGSVSILYFGARHTFDPGNPQFQEIEKSFNNFMVDKEPLSVVVLVEGFVPRITEDINSDIRFTGERGYTTHLAKDSGVRVECVEPDRTEEVRHLLEIFRPEEIEYYYYLRAVRDYLIKGNIHGEKTFEQYSKEMLNGHKKMFGSLSEFADFNFSFENMKNIHRSITGAEFDEQRMLSVNPRSNRTIVNKVAHECSSFRDFSHVRNIEKYLGEGYSVFIVCGSDHATIQRAALEAILGE